MTVLTPDPLLHPILLEFGTPELEHDFRARFSATRIGGSDALVTVFTLVCHLLYAFCQAGLFRDAPFTVYSAVCVTHSLTTFALATGRLAPRWRTPLFVAIRLVSDAAISVGMVGWNEPNHVHGWSSAFKHLLANSGAATMWFQSLAYTLPLKAHVAVQMAGTLLYTTFMAPACCRILLSHPGTTAVTAHMWSAIRWICHNGSLMGRIEILVPATLASMSESPALVCVASVSFLQTMAGLLAPLILHYISERTERQHFWAGLHGYTPAEVAAAARVHPLTKAGCAYVLFFAALCFWEAAFVLLHLASPLQLPLGSA